MRVLGIDPGLRITGYGCVEWPGGRGDAGAGSGAKLVEGGVFNLSRIDANIEPRVSTRGLQVPALDGGPRLDRRGSIGLARPKAAATISARLVELESDLRETIERLRPGLVAVEGLFAHYKHPATAISMGHARGVILLTIRRAGLELVELKPNSVKKSLTGHGHASKEQMQDAVRLRLGLTTRPEPADVADAIALALCAGLRASQGTARLEGISRPSSG